MLISQDVYYLLETPTFLFLLLKQILRKTSNKIIWFFFFFSDVPASGVYFTTYELVQRALKSEDGSLTLLSTITAGGCAGIANWIVGMPPDVLKSRLQTGKFETLLYPFKKNFMFTWKIIFFFFWKIFYNLLKWKKQYNWFFFQIAPEGTYQRGVREVFVKLMKTEGPTALYKGVVPVMLRAFPANAACFLGFEIAKQFLDWAAPNM